MKLTAEQKRKQLRLEGWANYERHLKAKQEIGGMIELGADRALCAFLTQTEGIRYRKEKDRLRRGLKRTPAPMTGTSKQPVRFPEVVAAFRQAKLQLAHAFDQGRINLVEWQNAMDEWRVWAAHARQKLRHGTSKPRKAPTLPAAVQAMLRGR